MSFSRWQVLEATERLIREQDDAASQRQVAQRTELAKSSVSGLMRTLSAQGLVDIRPDAWGVCDRIWLTTEGERLIAELQSELVGVARAMVEPATRAS